LLPETARQKRLRDDNRAQRSKSGKKKSRETADKAAFLFAGLNIQVSEGWGGPPPFGLTIPAIFISTASLNGRSALHIAQTDIRDRIEVG
jgi:hypothetical protein